MTVNRRMSLHIKNEPVDEVYETTTVSELVTSELIIKEEPIKLELNQGTTLHVESNTLNEEDIKFDPRFQHKNQNALCSIWLPVPDFEITSNVKQEYPDHLLHPRTSEFTKSTDFSPKCEPPDYNAESQIKYVNFGSVEQEKAGQNVKATVRSRTKNDHREIAPDVNDLNYNFQIDKKRFSCDVCDIKCVSASSLKIHKMTHTDQKPFSCEICGARFAMPYYLNCHMKRHTSEKKYGCTVCDKKFSQSKTLKVHMRKHTGERPFSCELCNASFTEFFLLTRHKRIHSNDKPYKCSECNSSFVSSFDLKKHIYKHAGLKPYGCGVCGATFMSSTGLKAHMSNHEGGKLFSCDVCSLKFTSSGAFDIHKCLHAAHVKNYEIKEEK